MHWDKLSKLCSNSSDENKTKILRPEPRPKPFKIYYMYTQPAHPSIHLSACLSVCSLPPVSAYRRQWSVRLFVRLSRTGKKAQRVNVPRAKVILCQFSVRTVKGHRTSKIWRKRSCVITACPESQFTVNAWDAQQLGGYHAGTRRQHVFLSILINQRPLHVIQEVKVDEEIRYCTDHATRHWTEKFKNSFIPHCVNNYQWDFTIFI